MDKTLPNAKSTRTPDERAKLQRVVARRGLTGLANDTKWDELIGAMRARTQWRPSYRFKCIDGPPSGWDVEWFYHLPFPLIAVEWLDIALVQKVGARTIDHAAWIEAMVRDTGLDYRKGHTMLRIFGYAPRSDELFDV
jgi:hypothetical protein